jgi:nucleoside 2-deoxyribosyltransferase
MRIIVCGSIGYGGVNDIRDFYSKLREKGFNVLNHVEDRGMDYSDIKDFRNRMKLSREIVRHDLSHVKKADTVVVLANKPSYGTAIEMYFAKELGKKIIFFAPKPIPTPWPLTFSDYVVKTEKELYKTLEKLKTKKNRSHQ